MAGSLDPGADTQAHIPQGAADPSTVGVGLQVHRGEVVGQPVAQQPQKAERAAPDQVKAQPQEPQCSHTRVAERTGEILFLISTVAGVYTPQVWHGRYRLYLCNSY